MTQREQPHEVIARRERERVLANLDSKATALYDVRAGWREFQQAFTPEELVILRDEFCVLTVDGGCAAYDDEVYDAIAMNERK